MVHNIDDLLPLGKIDFEGKVFNSPRNVDKILINRYGTDFMQIPPVEKRETHNITNVTFYE
jgi:lipopolysaccharide cholinephosphotransferase